MADVTNEVPADVDVEDIISPVKELLDPTEYEDFVKYIRHLGRFLDVLASKDDTRVVKYLPKEYGTGQFLAALVYTLDKCGYYVVPKYSEKFSQYVIVIRWDLEADELRAKRRAKSEKIRLKIRRNTRPSK